MSALLALIESRAAAGTRYRAAAEELTAAYVELAAYDRAAANANVNAVVSAKTFTAVSHGVLVELSHPQFFPGFRLPLAAVDARMTQILRAFSQAKEAEHV